MTWNPRKGKAWIKRALIVLSLMLVVVVICDAVVSRAAKGRTFTSVDSVPDQRVGLVLGCSMKLRDGRDNLFFSTRIRAAKELIDSGKAAALIVSGDNHLEGYDEPTDMKLALIKAGVPERLIVCDYAGFRTLDSVVRASKIFGQQKIIIVSQRFHAERAIYLAQNHGLDAIALNARDVRLESAIKTYVREAFARVKAVLDVHVLHTQPKFLGEPVKIGS